MHDDGRNTIAIDHLSHSGDLKKIIEIEKQNVKIINKKKPWNTKKKPQNLYFFFTEVRYTAEISYLKKKAPSWTGLKGILKLCLLFYGDPSKIGLIFKKKIFIMIWNEYNNFLNL